MSLRKRMIGLGIAAGIAAAAVPALAQMPAGYPGMGGGGGYPGMAGGGGGYPGMAGGARPGGAFGGAPGAGQQNGTVTTSSTTTTQAPGTLPKTGGDPLSVAAAGSMLLTGGYALRRKFRKA
jgi:LPXTG-motif cell wall-anchored protein